MIGPIFTAIRSWMSGAPTLSGKIEDTVRLAVADAAVRENYVILFPTTPTDLGDDRFTAVQSVDSRAVWEFDVRVVATSKDGIIQLMDVVIDRLVGHVLTISGRTCSRITLDPQETGEVEYDKTAQLYYVDISFGFTSYRSA